MKKKALIVVLVIFILHYNPLISLNAMIVDPLILTHEGSEVSYEIRNEYMSDNNENSEINREFLRIYSGYTESNEQLPQGSTNSTLYYDVLTEYIVHYPYGDAISIPGTMSNLYNCHAFALHFKGVVPNSINAIWISHPEVYFTDDSLIEIGINEVKNDDIIAYFTDEDGISHTGIITNATYKSLDNLLMRSKDGAGLLLDHTPRACAYYNSDANIKFYRFNHINNGVYSSCDSSKHYYTCQTCNDRIYDTHSITYTKLDNAFSHLVSCSICSYSENQAHNFVQSGILYTCLSCGFISKFQAITPNSRSINEVLFICSYDETQKLMSYTEMVYYLMVNGYDDLIIEFNDYYNKLSN